MANGDGYVLNVDFWAPLQADKEGKYSVVGRFARGDALTGVELPEKFLEQATSGSRPMLLKKDSKESETVGAPTVAAASAPPTVEQRENSKK